MVSPAYLVNSLAIVVCSGLAIPWDSMLRVKRGIGIQLHVFSLIKFDRSKNFGPIRGSIVFRLPRRSWSTRQFFDWIVQQRCSCHE